MGRRNANGHTMTRGEVYKIDLVYRDGGSFHDLVNIGEYTHQSGGADISLPILEICEKCGLDTNGGYYGKWHEAIHLIQL